MLWDYLVADQFIIYYMNRKGHYTNAFLLCSLLMLCCEKRIYISVPSHVITGYDDPMFWRQTIPNYFFFSTK